MLNANELNRVVKASLKEGIDLVLVMDKKGSVLSSSVADEGEEAKEFNAKMIATTSNLWRAYSSNDLSVNQTTEKPEEDALEFSLIDFGDRKLCSMSATPFAIVCLVSQAGASIESGMLKLQTASLQRQVCAILRPLMTA